MLVSPPSDFIQSFYFYYSTITVTVCWLMTPFLFYIILTQSQNLKAFKWFILNHSIWCLAFESIIGIMKPMFLTPALAGYPLGLMRDSGNFYTTGIATITGVIFGFNAVVCLIATIAIRYLLVFPSPLQKCFSIRTAAIIASGSLILGTSCTFLAAYLMLTVDPKTALNLAKEFDPVLETFFDEPAFCFVPTYYTNTICIYCFSLYVLILLTLLGFMAYFMKLISRHKKLMKTELQRSLIRSSAVQLFCTCVFLILPVGTLNGLIAFKISNSASFMCGMLCLLSSHCLIEIFVTLNFVSSYKKFVLNLFYQVTGKKKPISVVSITVSSSRVSQLK